MDISVFLAKLIGLYFLILSFLCMFRRRQVEASGKELVASKSALAVSAEISLLFGLIIAIDHSVWEYDWKGLITLLGYLMILRGVLRFGFPSFVKTWGHKMMTGKGFRLCLLLMLAIGIYLTYCGFTYAQMM